MQTKKITELLELLKSKSIYTQGVYSFRMLENGECYIVSPPGVAMLSSVCTNKDMSPLTERWNQLTGDNLKDVTWVI